MHFALIVILAYKSHNRHWAFTNLAIPTYESHNSRWHFAFLAIPAYRAQIIVDILHSLQYPHTGPIIVVNGFTFIVKLTFCHKINLN